MGLNADPAVNVDTGRRFSATKLARSREEAALNADSAIGVDATPEQRKAFEAEKEAYLAAQNSADTADAVGDASAANAVRRGRLGSRRASLLGTFGDVTSPLGKGTLLGGGGE